MSQTAKTRGGTPTTQDYTELLRTIDIMLHAFHDIRDEVQGNWYWWSLTIWARDRFGETLELANSIWSDFNENVIRQRSYPFGATSHRADNQYTAYYATSENGTESEFYRTMNIAESTVKALLLFFTPGCGGLKLSEYLDGFVRARDYYPSTETSPAARHAQWCWFEFMYSIAHEIGSPVRIISHGIPTDDFPPGYFEIAQQENSERMELRFHPEVRRIDHEFFEASLLALKFLRNKVEARIQAKAGQGKGGKITKDEANVRARSLIKENPGITARQLEEEIPCSIGLVSQLPAWIALQEYKRKTFGGKRPKIVSLTKDLEYVLGTEDEKLDQLVAEQEREDARGAKLYLNPQRKPKRGSQ